MNAGTPRPERFSRAFRLRLKREFDRVYDVRHRRESGPLLVYGAPNENGHPRIGLSVSRKVGNAVKRSRIKRQLRECFRRLKVDTGDAFDYVIVVRPHDTLEHAAYRRHLETAMKQVVVEWDGSRSPR